MERDDRRLGELGGRVHAILLREDDGDVLRRQVAGKPALELLRPEQPARRGRDDEQAGLPPHGPGDCYITGP